MTDEQPSGERPLCARPGCGHYGHGKSGRCLNPGCGCTQYLTPTQPVDSASTEGPVEANARNVAETIVQAWAMEGVIPDRGEAAARAADEMVEDIRVAMILNNNHGAKP